MKNDWITRILLLAIAIFLGMLALRPYVAPPLALAQGPAGHNVYIEPGTFALVAPDGRANLIGKVVVDLSNGNIWGFPTLQKPPYPRDATSTEPPVSKPMFLGRYDFSEMRNR